MNGHQNANGGIQLIQGGRKFYEIPIENKDHKDANAGRIGSKGQNDPVAFSEYINSSIIGNTTTFSTPFGQRRMVYCDHIASGKSVDFIEDFLR